MAIMKLDCEPIIGGRMPQGWGKLGSRGGGGGLSPFLGPPPFWAPVTGTPGGLTVTPNRLTGEVWGGGGVLRYHNIYESK